MKKAFGVFLCGLVFSATTVWAEVAEVKILNPSSKRLWLSEVRKP